jgi:hypothetical protein
VQNPCFMQTSRVTSARQATNAETALSGPVLAELRALLPAAWAVREETSAAGDANDRGTDLILTVETGGGYGRVAVDIKESLNPRDVARIVDRLRLTRRLDLRVDYLVAAPWLSPTTRAMLVNDGINYLDLTGNVHVHLQQPALYIHTEGAANDPKPRPAPTLTLKGPQSGRLVRALVDFRPPYTASAIATGAGISVSYASRQLAELDREALVERDRRGGVTRRDWAGLLRARARHYSTLSTNRASTYIAQAGARGLYEQLLSPRVPAVRAVSGSFAASRIAPVTAPAQLMVYVDDPKVVAEHYGLLPADSGADVVLLQPYDGVVFERAMRDRDTGLPRLAISQLALDCLSGNGRMPAEGEALIEWMAANLEFWEYSLSRSSSRP